MLIAVPVIAPTYLPELYLLRDKIRSRWYGDFAYTTKKQADAVAALLNQEGGNISVEPMFYRFHPFFCSEPTHLVLLLDEEGLILESLVVNYDPLEKPKLIDELFNSEQQSKDEKVKLDSIRVFKILEH